MASAGSIPGIPGASEPTFYTRDRQFIPMDHIVYELCEALRQADFQYDPRITKSVIQAARHLVGTTDGVEANELASQVCDSLRPAHIMLHPHQVETLLAAYGRLVLDLEITGVMESEAI